MADSDAGAKRVIRQEGAQEPPSKRQATEGGVFVKHEDIAAAVIGVESGGQSEGVVRQPVTADMAAELKRNLKEALVSRKLMLELELCHLKEERRLLDFAATVSLHTLLHARL